MASPPPLGSRHHVQVQVWKVRSGGTPSSSVRLPLPLIVAKKANALLETSGELLQTLGCSSLHCEAGWEAKECGCGWWVGSEGVPSVRPSAWAPPTAVLHKADAQVARKGPGSQEKDGVRCHHPARHMVAPVAPWPPTPLHICPVNPFPPVTCQFLRLSSLLKARYSLFLLYVHLFPSLVSNFRVF